jgi:hypothetical protein
MKTTGALGWVAIVLVVAGCQASISAQGSAQGEGSGQGDALMDDSCPPPPADSAAQGVDRGPSPTVGGNHETHGLPAGTYHGDLKVGGNHTKVCGAGMGATIIEGSLIVGGNHNRVSGITVRNASKVGGNHNNLRGVQFLGGVEVGGTHNVQ